MTEYVLVDNTVLCNFAAVGRLDLLEAALEGRCRVTAAVNQEMERSVPEVPGLIAAVGAAWLGDPIVVDDDNGNIKRWRQGRLRGTKHHPLEHLGEAESCHVLERWPRFRDSWLATDDRSAIRVARQQGIVVGLTQDLVAMAVRSGTATPEEGLDVITDMEQEDRNPRRPASIEELMNSYPY